MKRNPKQNIRVIDARMINMSGIGTYIKNNIRYGFYTAAMGNPADIKEFESGLEVIPFQDKIYGIKEQLHFPYKELRKMKPTVLHVPHYNVPVFYRGKMVVTIHDLTHLVCSQFLPNKFAYVYARIMLGIATRKASKIITVSECTKKDILKYYKRTNADKIVVTYEDISPVFSHKEKESVIYLYDKFKIPSDKKILMYVGNLKPHKNLGRLVEAYSKIDNIDDTVLVLVGKAFDNYDLKKVEEQYDLKGRIFHTGIVTDEELVDFYNLAELFVFPSIYEGFGLPPLEAMACGTPVVSSDSSSMPEVLGEAAEYFNPYNIDEMVRAINNQLKLKKEENPAVQKGYAQVKKMKDKVNKEMIQKCLLD